MANISVKKHYDRAAGFSLIEILVGVAIGLIGILVIFQMLSTWDARKRSTTAGSDAQIAGGISIFTLERDLKLAGWGFGQAKKEVMGCSVVANNNTLATPDVSFRLYPIQIVDGVGGAPDEIQVLYGNSSFFAAARTFTDSTSTQKKAESRNGFQLGDRVVVADAATPANCALLEISDNTDTDTLSVDHTTNSYQSAYTAAGVSTAPRYNQPVATGVSFVGGGTMYNLGSNPQRRIWNIANGRTLVWRETLNSPATTINEVNEGIVDLQAQYGINTSVVANAISITWTNVTPTDWTKLLAIRVGLLARSQQYEKTAVTAAAPSWEGGTFTMHDIGAAVTVDAGAGSLGPTNWRNYRYRVYEKVIPLRNVIWGAVP